MPPSGPLKAKHAHKPSGLPRSYQSQDALTEILGGALRVNIREIEEHGRGSIVTHRPIRQCFPVQPLLQHARNKPSVRPSASQAQNQVHSSRLRVDFHMLPQHAFEARCSHISAFGIKLPHPLDMASEVPFRDEGRDDSLCELGAASCQSLRDMMKPLACVSGTTR